MSDVDEPPQAAVPTWDDDYLQRVGDRLAHAYDVERDYEVRGERFDLYGRLTVESQKQFLHQSLNWANYETAEYLFVRRADGVSRADLDALVELGHELADDWIDADEEHRGTEFTFGLVVPSIPEPVREYVTGFRERRLLKFGYYGDYEVNLVVVAPDRERIVASQEADSAAAFDFWEAYDPDGPGVIERIRGLLG
ncbi:hypothetical protein [Haloarcula salinisoli]|uniref:DUF8052 domain-containing protein n=1 Tax=Haloarcula salinisoli TaxID=2487746 RepID=A0A8J8CBG2_9EURY|nr:hypothetical protein [Halomicroarcula salinisoli]MBX0286132.1 hypothetical protein [Halomicroarcula salinisoli]MBX0302380.1 hypothetical protein [Halomicroarcula salinisoli]